MYNKDISFMGSAFMLKIHKIKPFGAVPNEQQIYHMNLEKKAFFHFGPNTFTNLEWGNGDESASVFNPVGVDTDQWIRTVKEAGFKMAILTVKHHDGFCLWPSEFTEQSVKNSPYKNGKGDIVREFTDSCHKYGIRVGIYFSPWDRHSKYWGTAEYSDYYANQLRELVTNYGRIDEVWWDGAGSSETVYNWKMWHDIIMENQPNALMYGSFGATDYVSLRWVGNETGYASTTHYASIDAVSLRKEIKNDLNMGKIGGERYIPAEVDVSIRPGWFYHKSQSEMVKSPRELDNLYFNSIGRNAILLLNFPPNRNGVIEELDATRAIESHKRISKMLENNLAKGAKVTAKSVYSEETRPENVTDGSYDSFYAASENEKNAELLITLNEETSFNVFEISEVFELGERVTSFALYNGDSGKLIAEGTSIGRKKILRFSTETAKNLRVVINALTMPTVRSIALYSYEAPPEIEGYKPQGNLLYMDGANVEYLSDREVVLSFGGIYEYNIISCSTKEKANYEVFAFDGSKYYSIFKGEKLPGGRSIRVENVKDSYQLKIVSDVPFDEKDTFSVSLHHS